MEKSAEVEGTRYDNLPLPLKVFFVAICTLGIGLAVYFLFGFSVRGFVFLGTQYYFLLFASFGTGIFLILPARKKDKRIQWYDLVPAALLCGLSIYFFLNAWSIAWVGWIPASPLNFGLAIIYLLIALEGGRVKPG